MLLIHINAILLLNVLLREYNLVLLVFRDSVTLVQFQIHFVNYWRE